MTHQPLKIAIASRSHPDEVVSGDVAISLPLPAAWLLGVVDGLGHGQKAAAAAQQASATLEAQPDLGLARLFQRVDAALRGTRGAVLSLVRLDFPAATLTWAGVGNVAAVLHPPHGTPNSLMTRGGVVGFNMPTLYISQQPLSAGATLILTTDGIPREAARRPLTLRDPAVLADSLLALAVPHDDALVLIAQLV